jgi:hypothetical protein
MVEAPGPLVEWVPVCPEVESAPRPGATLLDGLHDSAAGRGDAAVIRQYATGQVPLVAALTLMRYQVRRCCVSY